MRALLVRHRIRYGDPGIKRAGMVLAWVNNSREIVTVLTAPPASKRDCGSAPDRKMTFYSPTAAASTWLLANQLNPLPR